MTICFSELLTVSRFDFQMDIKRDKRASFTEKLWSKKVLVSGWPAAKKTGFLCNLDHRRK